MATRSPLNTVMCTSRCTPSSAFNRPWIPISTRSGSSLQQQRSSSTCVGMRPPLHLCCHHGGWEWRISKEKGRKEEMRWIALAGFAASFPSRGLAFFSRFAELTRAPELQRWRYTMSYVCPWSKKSHYSVTTDFEQSNRQNKG